MGRYKMVPTRIQASTDIKEVRTYLDNLSWQALQFGFKCGEDF
jgi:hypothetical protein